MGLTIFQATGAPDDPRSTTALILSHYDALAAA